ncbi:hypothetical protein GCM10027065_27560 [Rhodanobacter koreensis]
MLALSAMALYIALPANSSAWARHHPAVAAGTPAGSHTDAARGPTPPDAQRNQRIVLHRNAGADKAVLVSVGIPFAPGVLSDPRMLRILDARGTEVPAAVQTTLKWHFKDGSVRAVRVQFHADLGTDESTFYFALGKPRMLDLAGWPYAKGLVAGDQNLLVPTVVATLTPQWLCQSLIAGPQQPAASNEPYANYVSTQFEWARELPVKDSTAWLFDRPTTLYKAYIRTGRFDYLQAAILSYHFYMKYIRRDGLPMSPSCAGGWSYGGKPCDVKYVYVEPILLSLALTGDDSAHDAHTVDDMATLWANGGWSGEPGPYTNAGQYFTERLVGLGLLETVSAYELTGEARDLARINERLDWLYAHQQNNPDGLGNDGSWRNSWNLHENDSWNPETDVRGASPWMTENIIDGLWHAWLVTGDKRIPKMITGFGRYLEHYGWISPDLLVTPHDWRDPCSGPNGLIAWYWSSAHATTKALEAIQDSEGWYSDTHNVELALPIAAAYYFERDPKQSAALKRRFDELAPSYNIACAASSKTLRRFNWNNRGSGVAQWLIRQPAGSGEPQPTPEHATP